MFCSQTVYGNGFVFVTVFKFGDLYVVYFCRLYHQFLLHTIFHQFYYVSRDISERNNDYSDTLDFRRGEVRVVTFFVLEVPNYKSTMLIYFYIYRDDMKPGQHFGKWPLRLPRYHI